MTNIAIRNFFVKLFHWEYWPFGIIQLPLMVMWLWYSLRERSFFYFTASNPGIYAGGMMGESKYEVLTLVPDQLKPKTILVELNSSVENVLHQMRDAGLTFPVIFKPDLGERGWMVKRINNQEEARIYLKDTRINFIIQELVDLPLEFGVYYTRFPGEKTGFVNSITGKQFLSVVGDGKKTLRELIFAHERACLQWQLLKDKYKNRLDEIIPSGDRVELVSIGNHCLGTTFLNKNHLITEKLSASFDNISKQINDFYFGRYDLRCASVEDLENGIVKIVELNGCGAEPSHIYHPNASLWKGIKDLIIYWQNMYRISRANHKRGVAYISFREGRAVFKKCKALKG